MQESSIFSGMRIIAGIARSRKIKTVDDKKTRPTLDRVKESIFNILSPRIENANVLDLFAGSGNLGLEALSRGAKSAVFIDNRSSCIRIIRENYATLGFDTQVQINQGDVLALLGRIQGPYDLIFIDPPYQSDFEKPVLEKIAEHKLLAKTGIIILEHHKKTVLEKETLPFSCFRQKIYGDTMVSFFENKL